MTNLPDKSPRSEIILYQTEDGKTRLQVRLENETVWLTQSQMADLFQTSIPNVSMHIRNIFREGELQEESVVKDFLTTAADGKRYRTNFFNLDVIISVGYRVKSHRGTQFRIWATQRLREYIIKGFTLDDERLKQAGGGNYFSSGSCISWFKRGLHADCYTHWKCSSPMGLRKVSRGKYAGTQIWGCSKYPSCKTFVPLDGK